MLPTSSTPSSPQHKPVVVLVSTQLQIPSSSRQWLLQESLYSKESQSSSMEYTASPRNPSLQVLSIPSPQVSGGRFTPTGLLGPTVHTSCSSPSISSVRQSNLPYTLSS